ncbi:hypothetical protein KAR91_04575, partial [Candidatus Pacearchaeota archaeon]|nr:hypothetical protein [Candidatus Pacearchaeota archaeon]
MSDDISALKYRLPEFLRKEGIEVDDSKKNPLLRCPDPTHGDEEKSATMYENERIHCFGCGNTWDIFDVAGLIICSDDFKAKKKYVLDSLGVEESKPPPKKEKKPVVKAELCPLEIDEARKVYTRESLQRFGDYLKVGEFKKCWLFKDKNGKIVLVEARFENEKKSVISIYWNGKTLKSANYPVLMYNADRLAEHEGPILIVEGAKCAEAADDIQGFLPITWNGGGKKAKKINWAALKGRDVYIWPDDDRHTDKRTGDMIPEHLQVGMQTAFFIQGKIPGAKIIPPLKEARKIKSSGADIVEALEIKTTEQIRTYILESEPYVKMSERPLTVDELEKAPFKILGLGDSGNGHIISSEDRLLCINMTSITKTHLLNITDISYWEIRFGDRGKIDWESA